jgi:hypothetical protein
MLADGDKLATLLDAIAHPQQSDPISWKAPDHAGGAAT